MIDYAKQNYSTGEFAKLCGVNKRTLQYYNDIGLFIPELVKGNGYRYYSASQFDVFYLIKILSDLGVSLREIKQLLKNRNAKDMASLAKQKISEIDVEINRLQKSRHILSEELKNLEVAKNVVFDEISIVQMQEQEYIQSEILTEKNIKSNFSWIIEYSRFEQSVLDSDTSFVGAKMPVDGIIRGEYFAPTHFFTFSGKHAVKFDTKVLRGGKYAVLYYKGNYEYIYKAYEIFMRYLACNNLQHGDYFYEEYLISAMATNKTQEYVTKIYIDIN